jgi:hypothetical protein
MYLHNCRFIMLFPYIIIPFFKLFLWCCYITVDSAMAASQNAFFSYKLSCHKKTNIMQIMTKNIKILFYESPIIEKLWN